MIVVSLSALTLWLGAALSGLGLVRMLTAGSLIVRLVAMNILGSGTLLILVGLSVRTPEPDPVPQALALTGIVITVAFTGVGLLLARAVAEEDDAAQDEGRAGNQGGDRDGRGGAASGSSSELDGESRDEPIDVTGGESAGERGRT